MPTSSKVISIKSNTTINQIETDWVVEQGQELIFEISNSSSFGVFVEGVALGFLRQLAEDNIEFSLRLHRNVSYLQVDKINSAFKKIEELKERKEQALSSDSSSFESANGRKVYNRVSASIEFKEILTDAGVPSLLCSIFGMQLLYQSDHLKNFFGEEEASLNRNEARKLIGECIWRAILSSKGVLGDGKKVYVFSRWDMPVPKFLHAGGKGFPSSESFRLRISELIESIGSERIKTDERKDLIGSWFWHIAQNAHEHGGINFKTGSPLLYYRGILVEKILSTNKDAILNRRDIGDPIKDYLNTLVKHNLSDHRHTLTVTTIMDAGDGIQNTLCNDHAGSEGFQEFERAFERGVSRFPSGRKGAGYGLADSLRVARKLNSYLFVCSGDVVGHRPLLNFKEIEQSSFEKYKLTSKAYGTAFSIIWPSVMD